MSVDYEMLGPAEKEIAKQLRDGILKASKGAQDLVDALSKIDLDQIEPAMLDVARKDGAVQVVELVTNLANNLSFSQLTAMITKSMLDPRVKA